jgi:hypothetical protein
VQNPKERPPPFASLSIDISERPTLAADPSAFALLAVSDPGQPQARVSATLYANAPEPTLIEIVDPRDLLDGLVRRRATYLWRSYQAFVGRSEAPYDLQKINTVGANCPLNSMKVGTKLAVRRTRGCPLSKSVLFPMSCRQGYLLHHSGSA